MGTIRAQRADATGDDTQAMPELAELVKEVVDGDELMIMTRAGQMIRMPVSGISVMGRNTQGVRLVSLEQPGSGELLPDAVAGVTRVVREDEEGDTTAGTVAEAPVVEAEAEEPTEE